MRPLVTERMRCRARSRTRTRHLPWRPRGCPTCAGFRCESGARESPCTLATTVTARSTVMAIRESKSEYDRDRCDIDRKSDVKGKSVSVRLDLGGRRRSKKKKKKDTK